MEASQELTVRLHSKPILSNSTWSKLSLRVWQPATVPIWSIAEMMAFSMTSACYLSKTQCNLISPWTESPASTSNTQWCRPHQEEPLPQWTRTCLAGSVPTLAHSPAFWMRLTSRKNRICRLAACHRVVNWQGGAGSNSIIMCSLMLTKT